MSYLKKVFSISIWGVLSANFCCSQIDYLAARDSIYNLTCGVQSAGLVRENQLRLEAISADNISSGKEVYYHDLGMTYYMLFGLYNDFESLDKSIANYKNALQVNPDYREAWRDLSHSYFFQKNCTEVKKCVAQTLKCTPRELKKKSEKRYLKSLITDCEKP